MSRDMKNPVFTSFGVKPWKAVNVAVDEYGGRVSELQKTNTNFKLRDK